MKIQIASDLHIEFERSEIKSGGLEKTDAEIIILAGDVGVGFEQESVFCRDLAQKHQKPVVFVLGNHSFYNGGNIDVIRGQWRNAELDGVHYLDENMTYTRNGILFIGGIFWTNFKNYHKPSMDSAELGMNDFIRSHMSLMDSSMGNKPEWKPDCLKAQDDYEPTYRFTTLRSVDEHYKTRKWLEGALADSEDDKRVVITHHAPCIKSMAKEFKCGYAPMLNPAYYSDMENWAKDRGNIDLWIHGHMHNSSDYHMDEGPRVICNPRGYVGYDVNRGFNPSMVVEV